jgi:hypothetical protein
VGFLDRLFGKKKSAAAMTEPPRGMAGHAQAQSAEEQSATRQRMEAELDGQRQRRDQSAPTVE